MLILYCICVAALAVVTPFFLKAAWPNKTGKSLALKMFCATMYLLSAVFAARYANNTSQYALFVLIALACCWVGDLLLHITKHKAFYICGVAAFLLGHIFYIVAFSTAVSRLLPGSPIASYVEWGVWGVFLCAAIWFILRINKKKVNKSFFFYLVYSMTILTMFVRAWSMGIQLLQNSAPHAGLLFALLAVGSTSFLVSDTLLSMIRKKEKYKTFPIKVVNILTYFAAQLCLAATVFLIAA